MIYLALDKNRVEVLYLKKSLLGQYETQTFAKSYQASNLLEQGKIINVDFVASAVKEALQSLTGGELKNKDVLLILPQESYSFLRVEVPADIASPALASFVKDKARSNLPLNLDECSFDYFLEESPTEKYIHFFAVENKALAKYQEALQLIDLKLRVILPETVTYFKLFQKTLRKDKKENILFVSYSENQLTGFLYDSFGQAATEKWTQLLCDKKVEDVLKEKATELEQKGKKLNRLILAGAQSDKIRQDTFTKEIGVWTNPLKRIIPEFYQNYLKMLVNPDNKPFSVLAYEATVGGFVFHEQHKTFSLLNNSKGRVNKLFSFPKINLPTKEFLIFFSSFVISFIIFIVASKLSLNFNFNLPQTKPKLTKTITPPVKPSPKKIASPTPAVKKDELKIKVLNGSGTAGKASEVKDLLKEKGYQEILTGNADNFDYEQTELQFKKSLSSSLTIIKNDLKDYVTKFKESTLSEDETADLVIIIGTDFETP